MFRAETSSQPDANAHCYVLQGEQSNPHNACEHEFLQTLACDHLAVDEVI